MEKKTLRQELIYRSKDGTLRGAAAEMGLSYQTIATATSGNPVGKNAAQKISEFTDGVFTVVELMQIESGAGE